MFGMNKEYLWRAVRNDGSGKRNVSEAVSIRGRIQKQKHEVANYETTSLRGVTYAYLITQSFEDYKIGDKLADPRTKLLYTVVGVNEQYNIINDNLLYIRLDLTTGGAY